MTDTNNDNAIFPNKLLKLLPEGFAEDVMSKKEDELKKMVFECESNIYTIEKEKQNDHKLNGAKDIAKELSAPYRDAKNCQTAKCKYILHILEGRGVSLDSRDDDKE